MNNLAGTNTLTVPQRMASDASRRHHPAAVYLSQLTSRRSQATMRGALNRLADLLMPGLNQADPDRFLLVPYAAMRYPHTAALRAHIAAQYRPARANTLLSALRGVLKAAWRLGLMSAEDYQRAVDIENVKAETLPGGRDLSFGEIKALADVCISDESAAGVRDAAIIGVLATCGVRRAELVNIDLAHFDEKNGRILIHSGKGNKDRLAYATNGALTALLDWLDRRGREPGPLFNPINKGGKVQRGQRMTAQAVYKLLLKRGEQAGVKDFSAHDFRRTFVGDLLDRGVDLSVVSKLAGHSDVKTTARYDRRPEETQREAAAKLHYPYQRKLT